MLMPVNLREA